MLSIMTMRLLHTARSLQRQKARLVQAHSTASAATHPSNMVRTFSSLLCTLTRTANATVSTALTHRYVLRAYRPSFIPKRHALSSTSSSLQKQPKRHQILVVGAGRMGHIRAAAFYGSRSSLLAGIVDSDPVKAQELAHIYHTPFFSDVTSALRALPELSGVWICTPTPCHRESLKEVIGAGLAVGIEKPVGTSQKEIHECYDSAAAAEQRRGGKTGRNVPLYCSFQRRIDPSYVNLLKRVRDGEIGEVRSVHAVFRDHPVPSLEFLKLGGDIFHDLVVHDADYIMHLLQATPSSIYALGSSFHPSLRAHQIFDSANVLLHFEKSAVIATIELSRSSPIGGYDQRIEVCGTKGVLEIKNELTTHTVCSSMGGGRSEAIPVNSFPERFARAYGMEVEEFIDVIEGKKEPMVTKGDSLNSTRIAEACGLSVQKGGPVPF